MSVFRPLLVLILSASPCLAATFGTVVAHAQPLADLVLDEARKRIYVVNTAANQVEVYSTSTNPPRQTKIASRSDPLECANYLCLLCGQQLAQRLYELRTGGTELFP